MILSLENSKNLGDNLLQFNYMRRLCIANPPLRIAYYCKSDYHQALSLFLDRAWSSQITLHPWESRPKEAVDTWIAGTLLPGYYWGHPRRSVYNEFYYEWFLELSRKLRIRTPISSFRDVAFDHPVFNYAQISDPWEYDVLVIDCSPQSGQFQFSRSAWDEAKLKWWAAKKKILSVVERDMSLVDIGLAACKAKVVVSVCTGPLHVAFNTRALRTVKKWHIFHDFHTYSYVPNIEPHRRNEDLLRIVV